MTFNPPPSLPRAILFDMDGTITRPMLDFDAIRADLGITGPILEAMARMTPDQRQVANEILDRHEREAAVASTLNEGCDHLLAWLAERSVRTALITRNSRTSVETVLAKHRLTFDVIFSREQEPAKPHPYALLRACELLRVDRAEAWMVGDGSHDIDAGAAAGIRTMWISHGLPKRFDAMPTVTVETLVDVHRLLRG